MDIIKKYTLAAIHESAPKQADVIKSKVLSKRAALRKKEIKNEAEKKLGQAEVAKTKEAKKFAALKKVAIKNEDASQWTYTEKDMAFSEAKTYHFNKPESITVKDLGGSGELAPIDATGIWDVQSPNIEDLPGLICGDFLLLNCAVDDNGNREFGFEADFGEDLDTMIYGYAANLDELKGMLQRLGKYLNLPSDILLAAQDFAAKVGNAEDTNESVEDMSDVGDVTNDDMTQDIGLVPEDGDKFYHCHVDIKATLNVKAESKEKAQELLAEFSNQYAPSDIILDGDERICLMEAYIPADYVAVDDEFDPEAE